MSTARFLVGDVFDRMADLPDGSVDLVLTSPPFLALRSYLPPDHPDKAKEIGSEPTPSAFVDTLLALTAEWRRVLAPHGSICVELGDTYSGSGGDYLEGGMREGQPTFKANTTRYTYGEKDGGRIGSEASATQIRNCGGRGWPLDKSLCGIPHLYPLSLAYGRNLLTGEPSPAGQWRVRNVVAWCRPNPPVGALGDKFRPGTSYMTVACTGRTRYFDLDAVRTPVQHPDQIAYHGSMSAGAPPLDWWEIPTAPYPGSHYATWPPALCVRPILAMCPQKVCRECGKPSERITSEPEYIRHDTRGLTVKTTTDAPPAFKPAHDGFVKPQQDALGHVIRQTTTLGWSDCGCSDDGSHWRPGLVLDPFGGSGTTAAVATGNGRDCILIDLDPRNADLARDRVGMFLEVVAPVSTTESVFIRTTNNGGEAKP